MSSRAETGVDSLDGGGTMAGMSDREPLAWAVFDGPDRMHLAPGYGEAESCAEDIGGEIVPLYRAPRWIPVSERLPEEDDYVLACHEGGFVRIAKLTPEEDDMLQCWRLDGGNDVTIKAFTHWMPLPEPPEVK